MSTDSTELTFVRCPSCRSLVPAVSTRCRMCGASLDASSKTDDEESQKKSGRVRQRTMSSKNDSSSLAEARDQARPAAEPVKAPPVREQEPAPEDDVIEEDPLSAYIEEVSAGEPASADGTEDFDEEAEDDLDQDEQIPELVVEPAPIAVKPAAPRPERERPPFESRRAPEAEQPKPLRRDEGFKPPREAAASKPPERPAPVQPTRASEPENRIRPKGGLSFGRPKDAPAPVQPKEPAPPKEAAPPPSPTPRMERRDPPRVETRPPQVEPRAPVSVAPPMMEPEPELEPYAMDEEIEEAPPVKPIASEPKPAPKFAARPSQPAKQSSSVRGRLFGWLVSYSDPEGSAIELREGKFFITRSSLKHSDLIVDNESVSTPHAIVIVDAEGGLRIQDLMSERGIFLRKRGAETYRREDDAMIAENGDWIRLGDVEFLVSLIPYVGQK